MSSPPTTAVSPLTRPRAAADVAGRALARTGATVGLAAALGACLRMVAAAAERPSVLSPPSLRSPQPWLLGPLHGALPHLTTVIPALRADLDIALVVLFGAWLLAWACAPALWSSCSGPRSR